MTAMVKRMAPKMLGLATIAGLFLAGGGSINVR